MMPPTFHLVTARICAKLCADSYHAETLSTDYAHCLGVTEDDELVGTVAAMVGQSQTTYIAFRGSASLRDWITDFKFQKTDLGFCSIHSGFWSAINSIIDQVRRTWPKESFGSNVAPYVITGHSLGGALAILCAALLKREGYHIEAVYTFGGPRVGDARFAHRYDAELIDVTFRLVDQEDIVPRMPPCFFGFRHVGREIFYPSFGMPVSGAKLWFKVLSDVVGTYLDWQRGRIAQFADHPIDNYLRQLNSTGSLMHEITEELKK